jgi:LysM repeat protein
MAVPQRSAVRRTGQVLTGFGALVVLCAVLGGAPIALLAFAGNPLPDHLPTLAEVGTTLTSRDDGQLFLRALAVVGWFGWATFAFSVLVELVAQVLRRPAPKLPGISRQQRAAAALVGSVALILAASPAAASAATLAAPTPVVAAAPLTASAPLTTGSVTLAAPPATGPVAVRPVAATGVTGAVLPASLTTPDRAAPPVYRVAKGDYLGEVAERYLDDFDRYGEVARLNRLADPDRIRPGQLLKLPEQASDAGARTHATGKLVVRPAPAPRTPAGPATGASPAGPGGTQAGPGGTQAGPGGTQAGPGGTQAGPGGTSARPGDGSGRAPNSRPSPHGPGQGGAPRTVAPQPDEPVGPPPAMAAGASRATADTGINRPLAISAVLAVASIVGAQIGAVLGLRRRPVVRAAGRALSIGRHRKD